MDVVTVVSLGMTDCHGQIWIMTRSCLTWNQVTFSYSMYENQGRFKLLGWCPEPPIYRVSYDYHNGFNALTQYNWNCNAKRSHFEDLCPFGKTAEKTCFSRYKNIVHFVWTVKAFSQFKLWYARAFTLYSSLLSLHHAILSFTVKYLFFAINWFQTDNSAAS